MKLQEKIVELDEKLRNSETLELAGKTINKFLNNAKTGMRFMAFMITRPLRGKLKELVKEFKESEER